MNIPNLPIQFESQLSRGSKFIATCFITLYFGLSLYGAVWAHIDDVPIYVPMNDTAREIDRCLYRIQYMLGLWQSWRLFSPPSGINFHCQAVVTFQDGTQKYYEFPRLSKMDFFAKFKREKLGHFFFGDFVRPDRYEPFYPDTARWFARANYDPSNPPATIAFAYNWIEANIDKFTSQDKLPPQTNRFTFFVYRVQPQDLIKFDPAKPNYEHFRKRNLPIEEIDPTWFQQFGSGDLKERQRDFLPL